MCDHGGDKKFSYLDILNFGEIYMCECGVLIDISQGDGNTPMTPDELQRAIRDEIADARKKFADKIRGVLDDDDSC